MSTKIALITGGSRGLGKSMALHVAAKGAGVVITYLNNAADAQAVVAEIERAGGKAAALQLNTGNISHFPKFAGQLRDTVNTLWGKTEIDFLVNNAGVGAHNVIASTTEEEFDLMINVHVKGVFFLTQQLLPMLADQGRIINISTGLTRFSYPGYAAYAAAKGAVEVFTRYLAKELGERQIAVNTIAPGAIETDFGGGAIRDNAELNQFVASTTALGRVGLPDDIGGAVASLLMDDNLWVNGQRIEVSGGQHL
ncbi:MAG: SDR family oxidoreductase [Bacteroidota bacterium]